LSLGYNFFMLDASIGDDLLELEARYQFQALLLFGRVYF